MMHTSGHAQTSATARSETDLATATRALFADIAGASGDATLIDTVKHLNRRLEAIRPYEAAFFQDRDAELTALSETWNRRDMSGLRDLIVTYFRRRQAIVPDVLAMIRNPN